MKKGDEDENKTPDLPSEKEKTRGIIVYPLPEEEFEYSASLRGPHMALLIASIIEWTKDLDRNKLYGSTSEEIREKIKELCDEYYVTDIIRRIEFTEKA